MATKSRATTRARMIAMAANIHPVSRSPRMVTRAVVTTKTAM
jgi:hypothetical protein